MADHVIVNGERVTLPAECENDLAARGAFIAKLLKTPPPPPAAEEKK
jgi:hypothetical protein